MKYLIFFLGILAIVNASAQQSISGKVVDPKGQPVPSATVFLTNTKNMTATDASGNFILSDIVAASYELVVNMIGFEPGRQNIKLQNSNINNIVITLKESN